MKRFAISLAFTGCAWFLTPVSDPATPDAPCGMLGVVCGGRYPHAICCDQNYECGTDPDAGFSTCPPGQCCSTLEPDKLGGARKMKPQWHAVHP